MALPTNTTVYRRSPKPTTREPDASVLIRSVEPLPSPLPPTSLLIRVHAVSLNFQDSNMLHGHNPWPLLRTGIPCSDAAGEVLAMGSDVKRGLAIGDRVCNIQDQAAINGDEQERKWLSADVEGVLATHIVLDEQFVVKAPKHLDWVEASTLTCAGVTAWSSLVSTESRRLNAGQTVLVQGTGGVSMMAMKLALAAGCRVFVTSSSDHKLKRVRETAARSGREGQIETINYRTTPAWDEEALRRNGGVGVDVVLENGGAPSTLRSLRAVKKGGTVSQVGYLGNQDPAQLEGLVPLLIDKTVNLRGINVGSRLDFEQMIKFITAVGLQFDDVVDKIFGFEQDEVEEAFDYLWEGKQVGKVVIQVS